MKPLSKQCMFSWFDSYDTYDEAGSSVYTMEGKMPRGYRPIIYNAYKGEIGEIEEEVFTFLPCFRMYVNDGCFGMIEKELSFLKPKSHLPCNDWTICGDLMEWEYDVINERESLIMYASKEFFHFTDTCVLNIQQEGHALLVLMIVLAVGMAKYSYSG